MIQVKFDEGSNRLVMVWEDPAAPVTHDEDQIASDVLFAVLERNQAVPPEVAPDGNIEEAAIDTAEDVPAPVVPCEGPAAAPVDAVAIEAVAGPAAVDADAQRHFVKSRLVIIDRAQPALG